MSRFGSAANAASGPVLAICALVMSGMVLRQQFFPSTPQPPEPTEPIVGRKALPIATIPVGHTIGDPRASVRIAEFADFQCPFCARAAAEVEKLRSEHRGEFAIEFHHAPLSIHPFARPAAMAAECAAEQDRFGGFYSVVYDHESELGHWSWRDFARKADVPDLDRFDSCVKSNRYSKTVEQDKAASIAIGVLGTPTWLVGDSLYGGVPPLAQLQAWLHLAP